jgi:small-conductance mechanosensitive channel
VNEELARARAKDRETLLAQQGQLTAALRLAREIQSSVQTMEEFETSSIAGDNGNLSPLEGQIADMERSVPELSSVKVGPGGVIGLSGGGANGSGASGGASGSAGTSGAMTGGASAGSTAGGNTAGAAASAQHNTSTFRPDSAGVIALISEWFSLSTMRRQMDDYIKETSDLQEEITKVRAPLTDEVRNVVGNDLAIGALTDPTQLLAQRQELEADTARFKKLSTVLVPLGEQALTVDSAAGILDDWRGSLDTRMSTIARYLAVRIGVLLGWIAAVLIVSEIWRRATFRYLHDLRRRRQFLVLRRVAVAIALTLVVAFGLVSEIGSIATYIGFITAGIAVALQNVILAVVGYFFFIGRYGVRVGDRITLSGVTGRVVDIGLVRIYLMELSGPDLRSTGRMVVLSNAVLFQPTAMFKQIPGADYTWHTVTLTIAATSDVAEAHKRLKTASDEVYAKYHTAIERQHAMVRQFIDFDASSPQPEVRLRLTENGLECSVRYPVELENAAVIDQQMLSALRDALEKDPPFKLVSSGAVVLKSE